MKEFTLKYGKGSVSFSLDESRVLGVLKGSPVPPITNIKESLYASLDAPIDSPPLREYLRGAASVALIVSDMSRFWMRQDLVIPHLVRYIVEEAGVPAGSITIVVANGTHPGGDENELRTLVTDQIYDTITSQKQKGVAVIYVGEDLDVLVELCDRILVLCGGKVSGIVDGRKTNKREIGAMMTTVGGKTDGKE